VPRHEARRVRPVGGPHETAGAVPLSESVQPTIASATANSLSSPQSGQFASNCVPEDRGVGGSIPPLTTIEFGLLEASGSPNSAFRVRARNRPLRPSVQIRPNRGSLHRPIRPQMTEKRSFSPLSTQLRIAVSSTAPRGRDAPFVPAQGEAAARRTSSDRGSTGVAVHCLMTPKSAVASPAHGWPDGQLLGPGPGSDQAVAQAAL